MPVILILMRGMIWQITSHSYPHQTAISLLQVTTSQSISTEGVVICHKIWWVAEWLCTVLHGSLVVCTARGGSRIAPSNVKYFYGVLILFIYLFFAFFFMSDDLWPEKGWNVHIIQKTIKFCMYRNYIPSHHSCRNIFPVLFGTRMHCICTFKLYTQCMRVEIYHDVGCSTAL